MALLVSSSALCSIVALFVVLSFVCVVSIVSFGSACGNVLCIHTSDPTPQCITPCTPTHYCVNIPLTWARRLLGVHTMLHSTDPDLHCTALTTTRLSDQSHKNRGQTKQYNKTTRELEGVRGTQRMEIDIQILFTCFYPSFIFCFSRFVCFSSVPLCFPLALAQLVLVD